MTDLESDYPKFPYDWDIDNEAQLTYYKKCYPYMKTSNDFENVITKSKIFRIYGLVTIIYFVILSLILLKHINHYIIKRQGRVYYLLFLLGSIINSTNSYVIQVIYYYYRYYYCTNIM